MKNKQVKNSLLLITFTVFLIFMLINIQKVWGLLRTILSILAPFFYGFIIAYILNFIYKFFTDKAFKKIGTKREKLIPVKKALSLICTYVVAFSAVALFISIVVPQIIVSMQSLASQLPVYAENGEKILNNVIVWINESFDMKINTDFSITELIAKFTSSIQSGNLTETVSDLMSQVFPVAINTTKIVINGVYNWIIAIIVSVYMLACKEKLINQIKRLVVAYTPNKFHEKILYVAYLSNRVCGNFLVGRIFDSFIIGVICFVFMSVFGFDYALLISIVICITNVIPFFGPFIGAIPSAFLLLMISPKECLWFIIFIVALQQLDGNLIGPKIIGNKIGISGIWIVFSVTVGGGLFGVAGMILGIPVFVVIYTLLGQDVEKRLYKKQKKMKPKNEENSEDTASVQERDSISEK